MLARCETLLLLCTVVCAVGFANCENYRMVLPNVVYTHGSARAGRDAWPASQSKLDLFLFANLSAARELQRAPSPPSLFRLANLHAAMFCY